MKPEEYLFRYNSSKVTCNTYKNATYSFDKEDDLLYKLTSDLWLHSKPDTTTKSRIKVLPNNSTVIVHFIIGDMAYIYTHENMGYVSKKYITK